MKTRYIHAIVAIGLACALTACDENSWNNGLDGFEEFESQAKANKQSIEYALSDADYNAIASNATNTALAGEKIDDLKLVGSLKRFSATIPAADYVPAFLSSTSFPYFTLTDGSSVKLTYKVTEAEPEIYTESKTVQQYTISDDQYFEDVWGSDDYVLAFTPSMPAEKYIPAILSDYVTPNNGTFCIVNYRMATQEPVFGGGGNSEPEEPVEFEPTAILTSVASGDENVTIRGTVMAACSQGYMLADNTGTIFVYMGSNYDPSTYAIGQQLEVTGAIGSYNKGLQVTGASASVKKFDVETVSYPSPKVFTGEELDQAITRTDNELGVYCKISGTTAVNGNNINIKVEGAETAQGSVYGITDEIRELLVDGTEQSITGYFIAIAGSRYCNVVVTEIDGKALNKKAAKVASRGIVSVPTVSLNAVYHYDGSKWSIPADFIVLNPDDYTTMGQSYPNLSTAEPYLSKYLNTNYPYASEGTIKYVYWVQYASGKSSYQSSAYIADANGSWRENSFVVEETNQFVRSGGKWMYDPNVYVHLPAGRNQELSTLYFQTAVDWVYENICRPLGDTDIKSGKYYVTSYGNNEYYSGTSAYQGNVDLRPSAAKAQYPAEYGSMSDDEVVELEKHRFFYESFLATMEKLHSDAKPVDGIQVLYTINFGAYNGSTTDYYDAIYEVVAPGKFSPVSCSWWENGVGKGDNY